MYFKKINLIIAKGIIFDKTVNLSGVHSLTFDKRISSIFLYQRIIAIKDAWEKEILFPWLISFSRSRGAGYDHLEQKTGTDITLSTFTNRKLYEEI